MTLDSTPQIPDRPHAVFGGGADPLQAIIEVIRRLELAGCTLIAMPCNTVHHWYDRLVPETKLPILHIADAVATQLRLLAPHARRVGLLGAAVISRMGTYSNRLGREWDWVYPSEKALNTLVLPGVAAVKAGDLAQGRALFLEAMQDLLAQAPEVIVYACTEIPVVLRAGDCPLPVIDSTDALAMHTVAVAQGMNAQRRLNMGDVGTPQ